MPVGGTITVDVEVRLILRHLIPATGPARTKCCDHLQSELPAGHTLTSDPALVTCPGAWMRS